MSNKQALREFQSRLAARLQSAQTGGVAASWLAVEAGSQRLLFPLSHAGEIFSWTDVQRVPYVQPWFLGVANLRGGLSGVIDLARFVGGAEPVAGRSEADLAQCRLVALNPVLGANCVAGRSPVGIAHHRSLASWSRQTRSRLRFRAPVRRCRWSVLAGVDLQLLSQHPAFLGIGV